jgi:hypothetical protein
MPPAENVAMQLKLDVVTLIDVVRAVPEQSPPQLVKLEPESAKAVSRTEPLNGALWIRQPVPQFIPVGDDVTVPVPFPPFWTVSIFGREKLATQVISAVSVTVTVFAVPMQSWPHPENMAVDVSVAVSVTMLPLTNRAEQVVPQSIPVPGLDATVPVPLLPCNCTVNAGA